MSTYILGLNIQGLHVGGDGAGPVAIAPFLGRGLKPDVTVLSFAEKILAVEVKILRAASVSSDVSKAVGQASLYRAFGFKRAAILLIDRDRALTQEQVESARSRLGLIGIGLLVRQNLSGRLTIDELSNYVAVTNNS